MKKTVLILALLFALAATPAIAKQEKNQPNENAKKHQVQGIQITAEDSTPTTTPCDPNEEYKNHGAYVSCVAKTNPGGQTVSAAAQSDIGKKKAVVPSVSPTILPTGTITPTATPSVSPTISPTEEPTPTGSPSGETTENEENNTLNQQIQSIIQTLTNLIESLKNLL